MKEKHYFMPQIEKMSRRDFLQFQWVELQKQIEYTWARSGLCQRQFRAAKIDPGDIKSWDDFTHKVPFTTKQDLLADQKESPPYGTRLAVPEDKIFATALTSGTSGKGQEVHAVTNHDHDIMIDRMCFAFTWGGWTPGERHMNTLPVGTTVASLMHILALRKLGCQVFNLGMYDTKTKLEYMQRFKLTNMFVDVSYFENLTTEAVKMGYDLVKDFSIRKILIGGAYPVSFIHRMENRWNARIFDYYGGTSGQNGCTCENGAITGDKRGFYHLFPPYAYMEVLNYDTGEPVKPGEEGELVVTPLRKEASPFLRFRTNDKVRFFPNDACDCGRPFNLIEAGTISRYDDMMKIKGINIWPLTIDEIVLLSRDDTVEYQGRVYISKDGKEKVKVSVEFKPGLAPTAKQQVMTRISNEIHDRTGINFIVEEAAGELPRYLAKARRWTDERRMGLEARN